MTNSETTTKKAAIITLNHNQQVRVREQKYQEVVKIWTLAGCTISELNKRGESYQMVEAPSEENPTGLYEYLTDPAECIKAAFMRNEVLGHGSHRPSALQGSSCLTADYPGKAAEMEAKRQAWLDAPEIGKGDIVFIEGSLWELVCVNMGCSDCLTFQKV